MRKEVILFAMLVALMWMLPAAAFGQGLDTPSNYEEDAGEDGGLPEDVSETEASPEESADATMLQAAAESKGRKRDIELPLKRKAKVVQKKTFERKGKWELTPFGGINPADSFVMSEMVGMRVNYRILEYLGLQVGGGYVFNQDRDATTLLTDPPDKGGLDINPDFIKNSELTWFSGLDLVFFPAYGKFSLLSSVIANYDFGLYAGVAVMGLENGDIAPAPDLGFLVDFYVLQWLSIRFDFTYYAMIASDKRAQFTGQEEEVFDTGASATDSTRGGKLVRHNYFVTLGLGFHLPVD